MAAAYSVSAGTASLESPSNLTAAQTEVALLALPLSSSEMDEQESIC